jgi:N-methylhydantoinase A
VRDEAARTYIRAFSDLSDEELRGVMDELASTAKATLSSQGIAADQQVLTYQVDLRYHGQGFEIPIEIDIRSFDSEQGGIAALRSAFDAEHERLFSFLLDNEQELVNVRAAASGPRPDVVAPVLPEGDGDPAAALRTSTQVWVDGSEVEAQVYDRAKLRAMDIVRGPAIVTEMDSTTLVLPGHAATVHANGSLLIRPMEG